MDSTHTPGPWAWGNWIDGKQGTKDRAGWVEVWAPQGDDKGLPFIACKHQNEIANARLVAAAPDLLAAQTMGAEINTPDFLVWIADRLVKVHGESPHIDYVLSLRERAKAGRAAIAKANGDHSPTE